MRCKVEEPGGASGISDGTGGDYGSKRESRPQSLGESKNIRYDPIALKGPQVCDGASMEEPPAQSQDGTRLQCDRNRSELRQ